MNLGSINSCKQKELCSKTSNEPIKCWKIFEVRNDIHYGPFTQYLFNMVIPGKILEPAFVEHKTYSIMKRICPWLYMLLFTKRNIEYKVLGKIEYNIKNKWWDISEGFIHTLSYCPEDFKSYCDNVGKYELWECEIPKNTLYFQADCRGSHYEANDSYASKAIKLLRLVDKCEVTGNDII